MKRIFGIFALVLMAAPAWAMDVSVSIEREVTGTSWDRLRSNCYSVSSGQSADDAYSLAMLDDFGNPMTIAMNTHVEALEANPNVVAMTVVGGFDGHMHTSTVAVDVHSGQPGVVSFFSDTHYEQFRVVLGCCHR